MGLNIQYHNITVGLKLKFQNEIEMGMQYKLI